MREVIEGALEFFADLEPNLSHKTVRDLIVKEIMYSLAAYQYIPEKGVNGGEAGPEDNLVLIDKDELDYLIKVKQLAAE
ncbi:hypothetical protein CL634_00295 [bacterium]|nr:hypothetical protein [bacterium]